MFLVAVTPRGEHNSNDMSLPTAGSFPELAAARLPPTSEEASWGQLSPQGHGWVSLSLCKTTVFGSSSTKNWEKKKKKKKAPTPLPAIWRVSRHKPKRVCHMYTAVEQGRRRQPICPVCCMPVACPRVGC